MSRSPSAPTPTPTAPTPSSSTSGGTASFGSAVAALMLFVLASGAPAELRPQPVVLAALLHHGVEHAVLAETARATPIAHARTIPVPVPLPRADTVRHRALQVQTGGLPLPRAPDDRTPHT